MFLGRELGFGERDIIKMFIISGGERGGRWGGEGERYNFVL